MTSPGWSATHKVTVPAQVDRIPEYDPRTGNHLWLMLVGYQVDPASWNGDAQPLLDQENLVNISGPGCFYCEQPWSPPMRYRRCKGRP